MLRSIAAGILIALLSMSSGEARVRHHPHHRSHQARHRMGHRYAAPAAAGFATAWFAPASVAEAVVANPAGCPPVAFCGCGAAVHIFGAPIRYLWLAANWFHFPRAQPAPGMAAVRRHHVFVLESHIYGSVWLTYDANSGHHMTRIHPRSIAGYTIVNPRG